MIIAVLCGGSGTRLWPLSRELMPKQFVSLINESLFQQTILRNLTLSDNFCIVTNDKHYFLALDEIEKIKEDANISNTKFDYILESVSKNTAAALLFVALNAKEDDIILALPSDHIIKNTESYNKAILEAKELAENGNIVVFGIKPTNPNTGYGYIKDSKNGIEFFEKPDKDKAKQYVESKEYYWNSGMFCFKAGVLINEFKLYKPDLLSYCNIALDSATKQNNFKFLKEKDCINIEEISIDYAIMEKSKKLKLVKSDFIWNDVGSFDALKDEYPKDSNNNASNTELIAIDSTNNFILSNKFIATIGIDDLIIIDTTDSLLISKAGESQKVKDIVKILKSNNSPLAQIHSTAYRPWGSYSVLLDTQNYKIKKIVVKSKKRLSLQKHFHRSEHWIVVSGSAIVTLGEKEFFLKANESTYIPMGQVHRLENPGKIDLVIIEVQVGQYLGEDDIVRLEDDFNRK
ncbi:mannose-1-phosphate guanylyltransferase/mannose-6-phosphate isomerase [Helicobacter sp. MIT 99-5507]|uniref:mannose-1-phosphate guanylyltransferase/mannose-6-phosphate isomerase n=1 Tax=Helicobacter sp. MIT 99-5507 TaxID=152489 RepID=UPI000E1EFFEC|nr:mannose-1-phosphate guanylyltransferase/mannose-6-phosphate isomerase [Helicobacter sp. MIT 99-5507]RDU57255.1 mannose-1-phosphate guanylyltransferase/mannose-6-phosphate isomerase [Helicobacter sp. MIT 99-5507]